MRARTEAFLRRAVFAGLSAIILAAASPAHAQSQPPSEKLVLTAARATNWADGDINIIQLDGGPAGVTLELDRLTLKARSAVIWLRTEPGAVLEQQSAEIALIGDASAEQDGSRRSGPALLVSAKVRGSIRLTADRRAVDTSNSDLYKKARALRESGEPLPEIPATPRPAPQPVGPSPVSFAAQGGVLPIDTGDDRVSYLLTGGVTLFQKRPNGDFIELQADRVVIYSQLRDLRELDVPGARFRKIEDAIEAAYLEGDVRITFTPADRTKGEQRLEARRVYYEFSTDRAILTDAVLHTIEPEKQVPVIVRARRVRQLAIKEFEAEKATLTTSSFKTPSLAVRADKAYIRQEPTGDPLLGERTTFTASNVTFNAFGTPFFYLPRAGGSITDRGQPLRTFQITNSSKFGFGVRTEWGLYETLGSAAPRDLDLSYRLDYLSDRGPATGINARYRGGFVTETDKEPWNFAGDVRSYLIYDKGKDDFGGNRLDVEPDNDLRGHALWRHQHFFPDNWQVQATAGWLSDSTFLEQFQKRDWETGGPHDLSLYLKRQSNTEAITFFVNYQPWDRVTTSDSVQEQFEVQRLPEIGYRRIGDSFASDRLTFFSENTVAALNVKRSGDSLLEQGYGPGLSPGLPSIGQTGTDNSTTLRGDFRQEIDAPFSVGQFKAVPYVVGRVTGWTDSPDGGGTDRLYAAAGLRLRTAFWNVNDSIRSDLFDVNRIRHVIEPSIHLFAAAQSNDVDRAFILDEQVDKAADLTGAQFALEQRWQTKRGGPGRWRSVDFVTFNLAANFYSNKPDEIFRQPRAFRGLMFNSLPETSIPRNSLNLDTSWRITDTTVLLADLQHNLDERQLATASVGLAVQRDPRLSYYAGLRYIEELNSAIATVAIGYELSRKYSIYASQSHDFSGSENVYTSASLVRRFDRFSTVISFFRDSANDDNGINFTLTLDGLGSPATTSGLGSVFGPRAD